MPVDRELFLPFTQTHGPSWPCPTCSAGHLHLVGSPTNEWTAETWHRIRSQDVLHAPKCYESRFVALLRCGNPKCHDYVAIAGRGEMEKTDTDLVFHALFVSPSPLLIRIPARCPGKVRAELQKAFVASWGDYSCAGNHVRIAVEHLLDALRINKMRKTSKGKSVRMPLHTRIESIKAKEPSVLAALLAIKWIGNAGSHTGNLTRESVFDALDIFESVLDDLYSDYSKTIRKLVHTVNRRKGPERKTP